MPPSARIHAATGLLFVALVFTGSAFDWLTPRGRFPAEELSRDGYRNGRNAAVLSRYLEDTSRLAATLRPRYNDRLFGWTGTASQEVLAGNSMLFFRSRVVPHSPAFWERQRAQTVTTVQRLRDLLARHGGELVTLVVPDRVRIKPDELPAFAPERTAKGPYYGDLLRDLADAGIGTIDYLARIQAEGPGRLPMHRADHHWNEYGARLASEAIADHLRERLGAALPLTPDPVYGDLERRLVVEDMTGSILRKMGWREESPHYARFHEPNRLHEVLTPDGKPYVEPWDEEIVVVADSFGSFNIAGQTALELGRPVSDMRLGAKGVGATLAPLLEAITLGWRPRIVVWLFEESGTYGENDPLRGWLADAPPSLEQPLVGTAVPLDSLEADGGVRVTVNRTQGGITLALAEVDQRFQLRLPRDLAAGTHLALTLRSTSTHRAGFNIASLALVDRARLGAEPDHWIDQRLPLPTERRGRIKLLVFPVPEGSGELALVGDLAFLGAEFEFLQLTVLAPGQAFLPGQGFPPGRGPAPYAPTTAERWAPKALRIVGRIAIEDLTEQVEGGIPRLTLGADRTCELRFLEPLPASDSIDLDFRVVADGSIDPGTPLPVLTVFQVVGAVPRIVYQAEVAPDEMGDWRTLRVSLSPTQGESRLSMKWSLPANLRGRVRAVVGFRRDG